MRGCEDEKMRRCFTGPHYWKNPALRRSREKQNYKICKKATKAKKLRPSILETKFG